MRILITPNGEKELNELRNGSTNSSFVSFARKFPMIPKHVRCASSVPPKKKYLNNSTNNSNISINETHNELNKTNLTKILNQTLEKDIEPDKIKLDKNSIIEIKKIKIIPLRTKEMETNNTMEAMKKLQRLLVPRKNAIKETFKIYSNAMMKETPKKKRKIPMKDIIQGNAYNELLDEFTKEKILKRKNYVMSNKEFRTTKEESKKKKLDELLNKTINSNRVDFINYIQKKSTVNMVFIKNISQMDESKMTKMNKICQLLKEKEENELRKKKKKEQQEKEKKENFPNEWNRTVRDIKKEFQKTKELLERPYSQHSNIYKKLKEYQFETTGKYWNKYNVNRLQRPIHKI